MELKDFVGIIVITAGVLVGYIVHENHVHPSPPDSCTSSAHISYIQGGNGYECAPGATMTTSPVDKDHILITCTCPTQPKPANSGIDIPVQ